MPDQLSTSIPERTKRHFLNLYAIALCDLTIDPTELTYLFQIGERKGVSRDEIEQLLLNPHVDDYYVPDDILGRVEYLYDFALMIWADGRVDSSERTLLERFCLMFKFEEENIPQIADFLLQEAEAETSPEHVLQTVRENMGI